MTLSGRTFSASECAGRHAPGSGYVHGAAILTAKACRPFSLVRLAPGGRTFYRLTASNGCPKFAFIRRNTCKPFWRMLFDPCPLIGAAENARKAGSPPESCKVRRMRGYGVPLYDLPDFFVRPFVHGPPLCDCALAIAGRVPFCFRVPCTGGGFCRSFASNKQDTCGSVRRVIGENFFRYVYLQVCRTPANAKVCRYLGESATGPAMDWPVTESYWLTRNELVRL